MSAKGGAGGSYKTYINTQIRSGSFKPTADGYLQHFESYWADKVVAKLKTQKIKEIRQEIGEQIYNDLRGLKKFLTNLTGFQAHIVSAKQIIVTALNRVKSIGTFNKTDKGFKAVIPKVMLPSI
jgi:hypothetical protein